MSDMHINREFMKIYGLKNLMAVLNMKLYFFYQITFADYKVKT